MTKKAVPSFYEMTAKGTDLLFSKKNLKWILLAFIISSLCVAASIIPGYYGLLGADSLIHMAVLVLTGIINGSLTFIIIATLSAYTAKTARLSGEILQNQIYKNFIKITGAIIIKYILIVIWPILALVLFILMLSILDSYSINIPTSWIFLPIILILLPFLYMMVRMLLHLSFYEFIILFGKNNLLKGLKESETLVTGRRKSLLALYATYVAITALVAIINSYTLLIPIGVIVMTLASFILTATLFLYYQEANGRRV